MRPPSGATLGHGVYRFLHVAAFTSLFEFQQCASPVAISPALSFSYYSNECFEPPASAISCRVLRDVQLIEFCRLMRGHSGRLDSKTFLRKALISEDEKRHRLNDVTEILNTLSQNIRDASFETKRKVCELLVQEIRVGRNGDGVTTLNIVYYFNKDWIKDDSKFELLTARTPVHRCLWGY